MPAAGPQQPVSERRQQEELSSAIFQLLRNVGLLCTDPLLNSLGSPPKEWITANPFASLAGQCLFFLVSGTFLAEMLHHCNMGKAAVIKG